MAKAPADQFYWKDWLSDRQLKRASAPTRGIWIDMLAEMWSAPKRGELEYLNVEEMYRTINAKNEEIDLFLIEAKTLLFCDVFNSVEQIKIRNRRMYREAAERVGNRERQKKFREKGGGDPKKWMAIRFAILERDAKMCAYCGRAANTVDHIVPKSKGGTEINSNLVACCKRCNNKKTNSTPEQAKMTFWKGFNLNNIKNNNEITPPSPSPSPSPKKKNSNFDLKNYRPEWIDEQNWLDLIEHRKKKKATQTKRAIDSVFKELRIAINSGFTITECVDEITNRGWKGFKANWMPEKKGNPQGKEQKTNSGFSLPKGKTCGNCGFFPTHCKKTINITSTRCNRGNNCFYEKK